MTRGGKEKNELSTNKFVVGFFQCTMRQGPQPRGWERGDMGGFKREEKVWKSYHVKCNSESIGEVLFCCSESLKIYNIHLKWTKAVRFHDFLQQHSSPLQ